MLFIVCVYVCVCSTCRNEKPVKFKFLPDLVFLSSNIWAEAHILIVVVYVTNMTHFPKEMSVSVYVCGAGGAKVALTTELAFPSPKQYLLLF